MSESNNKVMNDISVKYNPKTAKEGVEMLATAIATNNQNILLAPIIEGGKEFEQRMGRPMTYSEMRSMFG